METAADTFSYRASLVADSAQLDDEQLTKEILSLDEDLAFITARRAVLLAEVEDRRQGIPTPDASGPFASPSTSRWLADRTRRAQSTAGGIINDAVRLAGLPELHEAFLATTVREHHVREILAAHRKQPDTIQAAQETLVRWAATLEWAEFTNRLKALLELMDDVDPAEAALRRFNKRGLSSFQLDDMANYLMATTPEVRAIVEHALTSVVQRLRDRDWAELVATHGDDASWDKAVRNDAQRRHDALFMLITSGAAKLDPTGTFVVNVVLDHDTLVRESERLVADSEPMSVDDAVDAAERHISSSLQGHHIPAVIAMRMALAGHVRRVLYNATDAKIDVSRKTSLFRGWRSCCGTPAVWSRGATGPASSARSTTSNPEPEKAPRSPPTGHPAAAAVTSGRP